MNIFKILANGHGTVNENNISAFLGYLLDPNANHSLGYEFLTRFLGEILTDEDSNKQFEFKIFFEQEFRENIKQKKEVVDLVIVCYQTHTSKKKKTSVKEFIENNKRINKIILIENKINLGAKNIGQLERQYSSTMEELAKMDINIDKNNIHSIYVTPDNEKFDNEFETFRKSINLNSTHIYWKKEGLQEKENITIKEILENILKQENRAKIEAIGEYTKHTIKSFVQFIETNFKSEKEGEKDGNRDIHYSINSLLEEYPNLVNDKLINSLFKFNKYIDNKNKINSEITYRCSKTHLISVFYKKKKVFSLTRRSKRVVYHIILRNFKALQDNDIVLENYSKDNEFEFINYVDNDIKQGSEYKPNTFEINEITALFDKIVSFIK